MGTFDHKIHTTGQADTMDIFNKTYKEILGIETVPGTNMPANFGHMVGYDAQYYGYLVSFAQCENLSIFLLPRFPYRFELLRHARHLLPESGSKYNEIFILNFLLEIIANFTKNVD